MVKADLDNKTRRTMQELARRQMRAKLLADIRTDMMICDIEGWDKTEYVRQLQDLLNTVGGIKFQLQTISNSISRLVDEIETGEVKCSANTHISLRRMLNKIIYLQDERIRAI